LSVYLLEDLHWLDRASEALFAATHELLKETPTLLVLTFRPEYDGLWLEKSSYRQLALQPLRAGAFAELLRDLLGTDPSVVARAGRRAAADRARCRRAVSHGGRVPVRGGAVSGGRVRLQAPADAGGRLSVAAGRAPGARARDAGARRRGAPSGQARRARRPPRLPLGAGRRGAARGRVAPACGRLDR